MNKIRLHLIFQLVYLSYQSDHKKRFLTVMDCLKAVDRDAVNSFMQTEHFKEDANFHARYMLNKFMMLKDKNDSNESAELYPYSRYRHAIVNKVFTLAPEPDISIMIVSRNCKSTQTSRLKVLLQNYLVFCEPLNANNFNPIMIFSSFQSLRVKIVILLLPRMFIQTYFEMTAAFHSEIFHYITVDYIPDAIRQVQLINPLLKISDLHLINSLSMSGYGLMNVVNRTECIISKERIFFNNENDVLSYHYQSHRIIRIVTIFYRNLVFSVPNNFPTQNKCKIGLPCKTRLKKGTNTWSWLCCAGKYIDKLSAIMRKIKHPFIIYIVEDGHYGSLNNGNWNGLVDDLYQGKADIAIAELTFSIERFKVIDYIYELAENLPIAFLLKRPNVELEILNFSFLPENSKILICFLVLLHFTVLFIVYVFECIASQQNNLQKYSFKDAWSFVGALLFQRDLGGFATRSWPGRLLAITYAFAITVLISTYTATLTAESVSYEESPTFHGLHDEMFKDPTKRVGLVLVGIHAKLADRYNHTSKRFGVLDYEVAAKHLLEGKLDVVIGTFNALKQILMTNKTFCRELVLHVDENHSENDSWGCIKNSIICKLFSLSILHLIERKDFEKIDNEWISANSCATKEAKKYPWQYAGGLVICLTVATGICAVILILEKYYTSLKRRKRRNYQVNTVN